MKIIKSDGRHQMYKAGMKVILEFNMHYSNQRTRYWNIRQSLQTSYGPNVEHDGKHWVYNPHWRLTTKHIPGRARLFLRDEEMVSHILLIADADHQ